MTRADDYSREVDSAIMELNARRVRRVDAGVNFIVVLIVAILGAVALLHWLTPCEAGSLCMAAVIRPTRIGLWLRIRMAVRAWYLRTLIAACERDIEFHQQTAELAPELESLARQRRDELTCELIDCELCTRST